MHRLPLAVLLHLALGVALPTLSARETLPLSGQPWRAWLDREAAYVDDVLFLPGRFQRSQIPTHPPTCGWDELFSSAGVVTALPASFEQLFGAGDPRWRYHGVGWFATEVEVPAAWSGKTITLSVGKARLRLEIYINGTLVGYDLVAETPYEVEITPWLRVGAGNRIAFRVTNPGGQRGWNDSPCTVWGKNQLPPGHDFGGIGGEVALCAMDPIHLEDLWVKNLPPAGRRRIEVRATVINPGPASQKIEADIAIAPWVANGTSPTVSHERVSLALPAHGSAELQRMFEVPMATLWSPEHPALYLATVRLRRDGAETPVDDAATRFGFRVFEAKANLAGEHNLYLNGERIRLRSAIDWGYYAGGGFFPTPAQARRSVENSRAVGHNAISFHRRIGEPLVMDAADELGVLIYEEPGGAQGVAELRVPSWIEQNPQDAAYPSSQLFPEKFSRMVRRDRSHPSVIIWSIGNEICTYDYVHKRIFREARALDDSRLLVNQSGGQYGHDSGPVPHYRPYEARPRLDYVDDHSVDSKARFPDSDLLSHRNPAHDSVQLWGEVRCVTGPHNWPLLARFGEDVGYDGAAYRDLAGLITEYHRRNSLGSRHPQGIATPADLVRHAAAGLMYADGRLGQSIMVADAEDGYAINGWSDADPELDDEFLGWSSAICDVDRNVKGVATEMARWNRDCQIAIFRRNGTGFRVGDVAEFEVHLINERRIQAGNYQLRISVTDGSGAAATVLPASAVVVAGGDVFAQALLPALRLKMDERWHAGYVTVRGELLEGSGQVVAEGHEQVLLQNRSSWRRQLADRPIAALNWPAARTALEAAGAGLVPLGEARTIVAAGAPPEGAAWDALARQVVSGATLVVRFDAGWAAAMLRAGWLKEPVNRWAGEQKGFWNGNGWGYLEFSTGSVLQTVGTNSWEVGTDPVGFSPFVAAGCQTSWGAWVARPSVLLTLLGEMRVGSGRIVLAPGYPVDADNAFNDLLFFSLVTAAPPSA
jgi:hypothetical protein